MSNMNNCANCLVPIKANVCTTHCDACQSPLHLSCTGLTENDIKLTRSKSKSFKVVCSTCDKNMTCFKDLKSLVGNLRSEFTLLLENLRREMQQQLDDIKSTLNEGKLVAPPVEEVIEEVMERQKRSRNVIMFNIPEQQEKMDRARRLDNERTFVLGVLDVVNKDCNASDVTIARLGKYNASRTRPVRVTFKNDSDVHRAIRGAKNLKENGNYSNVRLSFDRTPKQIELYGNVKRQLDERKRNGEQNLGIRYRNGNPIIVNLN